MTETVARPARRHVRARPSGGASVLETVRKALALESRQAYQDRSTQGGLAAFIAARVAEAPPESQLHARLQRLHTLLADYEGLAADARQAAIRRAAALVAAEPSVDQPAATTGAPTRRPAAPRTPPADKPATARERQQAAARAAPAVPTPQASPATGPRQSPPPAARPVTPAATRRAGTAGQPAHPSRGRRPPALQLDDPVQRLPRLGTKNAKLLEKLDVRTVQDLIFIFPAATRRSNALPSWP